MNFDWLPEYRAKNGCPWSDSDFERYGLNASESLYAWTLTHINGSTLKWVRKMLESDQADFGIEETWIYSNHGSIKVSDNYSDVEYVCSLKAFKDDLEFWSKYGS